MMNSTKPSVKRDESSSKNSESSARVFNKKPNISYNFPTKSWPPNPSETNLKCKNINHEESTVRNFDNLVIEDMDIVPAEQKRAQDSVHEDKLGKIDKKNSIFAKSSILKKDVITVTIIPEAAESTLAENESQANSRNYRASQSSSRADRRSMVESSFTSFVGENFRLTSLSHIEKRR